NKIILSDAILIEKAKVLANSLEISEEQNNIRQYKLEGESESADEAPTASTNQSTPATKNTNPSLSLPNIDSNTKIYIEAACQALSNMIISTIKEYIDQTLDAYMVLINKLNKCIDSSLNQQKQNPQLTHST
ncbi:15218_t:CDS:2, partial [Racocetra fulgida]